MATGKWYIQVSEEEQYSWVVLREKETRKEMVKPKL